MGNALRRAAGVVAAGTVVAVALAMRKVEVVARDDALQNAVALVTGGSRGLGLAIGRELAARGCRLAICARDEAELLAARHDLEQRGAEVLVIPCDVADRAQVDALVEAVTRHFGRIDILVNNAGIIVVAPLETLTAADFERMIADNFWGVVNPTLAVLPGMRERRSGRIVNITSIGGKIAVPHLLPYTCAKFGTVGFSSGLRAELSGTGISVTTVVPGLMRTGSFLRAEFGGRQEAEYRWFALGASAPYPVTVSAERAAALIVDAARDRKAECTYPITALLAARFAGLFPGATAEILALVDRLLPGPPALPTEPLPGAVIEATMRAPLLEAATILGRKAAEEYNERAAPPVFSRY
ncbi:MAG: SDR family oxidoreductase [Thermomicrobiales bacterium]|nr:SDR family oxidoreductase [Thermomicrobiales bacterium]